MAVYLPCGYLPFILISLFMSRTLFLFLLLALGLNAVAQYGASYKLKGHEIGLEPIGLRLVPAYTQGYLGAPVSAHLLRGLRYKLHTSKENAVRLGVFQQRRQYLVSGDATSTVARRETQLQLGYERKATSGPHVFFGGGDALFNQGSVEWEDIVSVVTLPSNTAFPNSGNTSFRSYGGSLFAGYRYYFSPYVSATFELSGYFAIIQHDNYRESLADAAPYLMPQREAGIVSSVYLSFHFGSLPDWGCTCPKH